MPDVSLALAIVSAVVFGLVIGQPFHVLLHRSPMRMRLTRPHLHCQNCGIAVGSNQRIALLATATKRSHCRTCDTDLWPDAPLFDLALAAFLGLVTWRLGLGWALPAFVVFFASLLFITVVDYRTYIIPNRVLYPTLFTCLALLVVASAVDGDYSQLIAALIGMAAAWFFFFIVWFAYPAGMGFGDVRLAALIGLLAGWMGFGNVVMSILFGLILGAVVGLVMVITRLRGRKEAIPFGPFLALGATISILAGEPIYNWWMGV